MASSIGYGVESSAFIYLGMLGLTMMEYGTIRKSTRNQLLVKNFLQFSIVIVCFWLLGYGFSFGQVKSKFIGETLFGGDSWKETPSTGQNFSRAVTLCTFIVFIINGSISEKTQYGAYVIMTICVSLFIWPTIFAWKNSGWLMVSMEDSMIDLGSAYIYTFAGAFALTGAVLTGRREGRFNAQREKYAMGASEIYVLGAFLTILGCFGIPNILPYAMPMKSSDIIPDGLLSNNGGMGMANLWICGAVSSVTSLKLLTLMNVELDRHYISIYQGFIAGMVFISSACVNTSAWESGLHGLMSGGVFSLAVYTFNWLKVDDSLYFGPTFLFPGIFGGWLPGFIDHSQGVYWTGSSSGETLATNIVGTTTILFWALFWGIAVFGALKLVGLLKLPERLIEDGLAHHSEITQSGFKLTHHHHHPKHSAVNQEELDN